MTPAVVALASAGVVAVVLTPVVTRTFARWRVVSTPSNRSSHVRPVPQGVGIVVAVAVPGALLVVGSPLGAVVAGAVAVAVLGLADDVRELPWWLRLLAQLVVSSIALVAVAGSPDTVAGLAVLLVAVVATSWTVNAVNFMDGIDGITAATGVVCGLALVPSTVTGTSLLGWALVGGWLGYLPWNLILRTSFPGDAGAYFLGMVVPLAVAATRSSDPRVVLALGALAPTMTDTVLTLVRRVRAGHRPTAAHRDHAYQRLARVRGSHLASTATFAGLAGLGSVGAWLPATTSPAVAVVPATASAVATWWLHRHLVRSPVPVRTRT